MKQLAKFTIFNFSPNREAIFDMKADSKENLVAMLNTIPDGLETEDVEDLFFLVAKHYVSKTPSSIKEFHPLIFNSARNDPSISKKDLAQALCLPVWRDR